MAYLAPADYEAYGLDADTPDSLVTTASALIEAHCRRPSLLAASYTERLRLIAGSQTVRLSYGPILADAVISARVRYARPRRGEDSAFPPDHHGVFVEQIATAFGLPGTWSPLDVTTIDVYPGPAELTLPANLLGLAYNEVEIIYTGGFVTVPVAVKAACAQIVRNAQAIPALNVKSSRLDTMQITYFSDSLLDEGVQALLKPYRAERLG